MLWIPFYDYRPLRSRTTLQTKARAIGGILFLTDPIFVFDFRVIQGSPHPTFLGWASRSEILDASS